MRLSLMAYFRLRSLGYLEESGVWIRTLREPWDGFCMETFGYIPEFIESGFVMRRSLSFRSESDMLAFGLKYWNDLYE